jgi:integrase
VTSWLLNKYKGVSTKSARGGSAGTYASLISHLIRFVYRKRISFEELNDDHMFEWADDLREEKDPRTGHFRRRKNTQIGRIMRRSLYFLQNYQETFLYGKIIVGTSIDGASIKITWETGQRGKHKFSYISHQAIPKDSVPEDVKPISHSIITKLYDAIPASSKSIYVRKRRQQLLRLLEATGGRRYEISKIKILDVEQAVKTERLRMIVVKKIRDEDREVPVSHEWLDPIIVFIQTHRKNLVKRMIKEGKIEKDPGDLFLSESTGRPLSEETITSEISQLRRIADIDEKACAHMFRHRFITLQVIYRLKAYIGQELPMALLYTILTKVMSITGHKRIESLLPYVDLAFQEMGVWDTSEKVLKLRSRAEAAFRQIQTLRQDVMEGRLGGQCLIDSVLEKLGGILSDLSDLKSNEEGMLSV